MLAAAANSHALWYLTRATGLLTLLLLTGSVVLGIMGAQRWSSRRWPRFVTGGLHKNLSLLAVVFLAVHIVTAVTDSFVTIRWINVFVPFTATYRPVWLGLGAVASDLLIALIVTSLARQRIGYRAWRVVHWAAYACWPIALVHGLGTGTDARYLWALAVFLGCLAAVCGATWWRLGAGNLVDVRRRAFAWAGSVIVPLVALGWLAAGPLQPGWAAKAGTPVPAASAGAGAPAGIAASAPATSAAAFASPFTATLTGTAAQGQADTNGNATVTLSATLAGNVNGVLAATLTGRALPTGGVTMSSSSASLGPASQPALYSGQVTALAGNRLTLRLNGTTAPIYATLNITIDARGNLTGTMQTSARPPA
jgi:Ferric reductase like transmembrane component